MLYFVFSFAPPSRAGDLLSDRNMRKLCGISGFQTTLFRASFRDTKQDVWIETKGHTRYIQHTSKYNNYAKHLLFYRCRLLSYGRSKIGPFGGWALTLPVSVTLLLQRKLPIFKLALTFVLHYNLFSRSSLYNDPFLYALKVLAYLYIVLHSY